MSARRIAAGLALAGALALTTPAQADLLGYILGRGPAQPAAATPVNYPAPSPRPTWEGYLNAGTADAGRDIYLRGQLSDGRSKVVACQACHGPGGVPPPGTPMPRLGGVTADYIAKQLDDYKEGRRKNAVMQQVAHSLTAADMGSAALFLASLPSGKWENTPTPGHDVGRRLQAVGDNDRAIPACGNCHGPQGRGSDQLLPPLAGLNAAYLREQLREWRSGERSNDDLALMRTIAAKLTDDEITSLADYYASMR